MTDGGTPVAVSLFTGLGGLDIGLHQAGIRTAVCVEVDSTCAATLRLNSTRYEANRAEAELTRPSFDWEVLQKDIRDVTGEDICQAGDISLEEIAFVVGGPPCQTFSKSNEGNRSGTASERGRLYEGYVRLVQELKPKAFIFENVPGLNSANNGVDLDQIKKALAGRDPELNGIILDFDSKIEKITSYEVNDGVLNAADFGVPQTRKRLFIIGRRDGCLPEFPKPLSDESPTSPEINRWQSAGEALECLSVDEAVLKTTARAGGYYNAINSKYGPLLRQIPEGANYQHFSQRKYDPEKETYVPREGDELEEKEFDWRSRHWNYLLKLDRERPAWTLQASPGSTVGPFHWRSRPLSKLEQLRLQSIPLKYVIAGDPPEVQEQIGNAVPPRLASELAATLLRQLNISPDESVKPGLEIEEGRLAYSFPENSRYREPDTEKTLEVNKGISPWIQAVHLLGELEGGGPIEVQASKSAIPIAVDVVELARLHASAPIQGFARDTAKAENSGNEVDSELRLTVWPLADIVEPTETALVAGDD